MKIKPVIVLFGQDLRLADNPALTAAVTAHAPLILLYILDDATPGVWKIGSAQRWWLHESLQSLQQELSKYKQKLVLRKGPVQGMLAGIVKETGASTVYYNRRYEPWCRDFQGFETKHFNGSLLIEPWEVYTKNGEPFRVFTPFWKRAVEVLEPRESLPVPKIPPAKLRVKSDALESWALQPQHPDWAGGIRKCWKPGEKAALKQLDQFVAHKLRDYPHQRDFPAAEGTSRLSPYLHLGEISPHQIWDKIKKRGVAERAFLSEIGWREFSYYLLYHFPSLPKANFNPRFDSFPWAKSKKALELWQKGMTGYPIVDAGMRELWQTGWMHNRVRMIVASFLTKDLQIHWKKGADWFWDTLVDADLANNSASWQWVAGCGADAAPYFRIFNPTLQGIKFDPDGEYVRKWVPELAKLKGAAVHEPWKTQGLDYPKPIVDHKEAREEALALFATLKKQL